MTILPITHALGRSGVVTSPVVFGAMGYGLGSDERRRIRTLHAAIDHGITTIDTAPLYGFGDSETMVGRAIADRRERVQVMTKVGLRWDSDHGDVLLRVAHRGRNYTVRKDGRPAAIRRDVEASLKRLGIDSIDVCHIHHPDRTVPIEDTLSVLDDLRQAGVIRAIGVSNFDEPLVEAALQRCPTLASHQLEYSLLTSPDPSPTTIAQARHHGMAVLAYSPLFHGALCGHTARPWRLDPDDPRQWNPAFVPRNARQIDAAVRSTLEPLAYRHHVDVAQIALAWLLHRPGVTGVIVGARTPAQAIDNARAMHIKLSPREVEALRQSFAMIAIDPTATPPRWLRAHRKVHRLGRAVLHRIRPSR